MKGLVLTITAAGNLSGQAAGPTMIYVPLECVLPEPVKSRGRALVILVIPTTTLIVVVQYAGDSDTRQEVRLFVVLASLPYEKTPLAAEIFIV
jgi:hypothetical protein